MTGMNHRLFSYSFSMILAGCAATAEGGGGPGTPTLGGGGVVVPPESTCRVEMIPFAAGVDEGDPVHFLTPPSTGVPNPLGVHDGSGLHATTADFCATSSETPAPGSPCRGLDAFSWGLDWIPAELTSDGDAWRLVDPDFVSTPGWAVLFFERGGDIYAWGWGDRLNEAWPELGSLGGGVSTNLIRDEFTPPAEQKPIHKAKALGVTGGMAIDGLDFHAWIEDIGPGWDSPCSFELPHGTGDVDPRLFYSVPRPGAGAPLPGQGAMVYWTEPRTFTDETYFWSRPRPLCNEPMPGLPANADIDALAYFQDPHADPQETGEPRSGLLMFSLTEDSWSDDDEPGLPIEPGDPFYAVAVLDDGEGGLEWGVPRPIVTPMMRPLRDVVGPRSRGVCNADPGLFLGRQASGR